MTPIVVCTVTGKSLPILQASIRAYCPDAPIIVHHVERSTFGRSYNMAMEKAFNEYPEIIIANDDVVLTPSSYAILLKDAAELKVLHGDKLGFVAARSDYVRDVQDIKKNIKEGCLQERYVSPLFAWISKKAFSVARFPETNWFSDDVMCLDLLNAGFVNYVSNSYVHHAGSQTIGHNYGAAHSQAIEWLEKNRPDIVGFFKR